MKSPGKLAILVISAIGLLVHVPSARASLLAHLTLQGDMGNWVSPGNYDIFYSDAEIKAYELKDGNYWGVEFFLGHITWQENTYATISFMTDQPGVEVQPGTYIEAQRLGFAQPGHPGLDVSFQNRGCNIITGQFTVTNASFYQGKIGSFTATFEQYCENLSPPLLGTFSFVDTSAPSAVPEPGTMVLVCTAGLVPVLRRRRPRHAR